MGALASLPAIEIDPSVKLTYDSYALLYISLSTTYDSAAAGLYYFELKRNLIR